ncbi:hypothetical protein OS493_029710 [Desmophyllum pertusum]|uniref:Transglutaminase N-terminal domain-containing protein n=1 Tax=Desmophyllum pertusum TaxID=174260 RepID=A0A9X0CVR0_9CNID|nr:hypothetical protein OS493_029710 [Desmophyllum pertusum]
MTTFALVHRQTTSGRTDNSTATPVTKEKDDKNIDVQRKRRSQKNHASYAINGGYQKTRYTSQIGLIYLKPIVRYSTSVYFHSKSDFYEEPRSPKDNRAEAERVRCGLLGDGVSGRANVISDKEFRDKNKALTTSNQQKHAEQLIPKDINLHKDENRRNHHTDKYEHSNLIVRRGHSFDVTVTFNRPYEALQDTIILQFAVGYRPQESKGSIIRVPLTKETVYGAWSVKIAQFNRENVRLQVTSAADAVVGRYQFYVETKTSVSGSDKQEEFRYQYPEEIIVLFNPWCKG